MSIIFIVISIAGGIFVFFYISGLKEKIPEDTGYNQIFIAADNIKKNEEITPELVEEQKIPADIFSEKFIIDKNEIIGEKTAVDILEGEIITKDKLEGGDSGSNSGLSFSSYIPDGLRAVSIPVNFYGDRSLIKEGDRVDLISIYYEPSNSSLCSQTILSGKEIVLIGSRIDEAGEDYQKNVNSGKGAFSSLTSDSGLLSTYNENSLIVTFYLSKKEAEEVFKAIEKGTVNLSICCRD
ncbi:MAG: Flp pilus assembly protein CpaB [Actinomycetota bacterium]|nr:Flp pilus assembly protein CpaB [Actinomycetota bacterium]